MSKNMNKRFFAEFLALLSLKVNPDPDANDDAEIDIVKQIFATTATVRLLQRFPPSSLMTRLLTSMMRRRALGAVVPLHVKTTILRRLETGGIGCYYIMLHL